MDDACGLHLFDDRVFFGVGSSDGFCVELGSDRVGFGFGSGEVVELLGFIADDGGDAGHGGVADDEAGTIAFGSGLGGFVGDVEGLDGGGCENGVFGNQRLVTGIEKRGEGDEEWFALGHEDDVLGFGFGK